MKISNQIAKISLKNPNNTPDEWFLTDTRQINIFIGSNNVGKSRIIRKIFKHCQNKGSFVFDYRNLSLEKRLKKMEHELYVNDNKLKIRNSLLSNGYPSMHIDSNIRSAIRTLRDSILNIEGKTKPVHILDINKIIKDENEKTVSYSILNHILRNHSFSFSEEYLKLKSETSDKWNAIYLPTLRSLRNPYKEDVYLNRTVVDYFYDVEKLDKNSIFTGHKLYEQVKHHLLGTHEERDIIKKYENYLSMNFFFGNKITITPRINEDVVYIKEGDMEEHPIYDLGDGIQTIILLTFPVFMAKEPTMFFIEEPEHHLHAGLQRILINTFAERKMHMFFLTTHSNHILDLSQERDDISIQYISRENNQTKISPSIKHSEILNQLGVKASSVLLANCSIWVEGITDKLYLRTCLNKYMEHLKKNDNNKYQRLRSYHENLHYIFVEYQGSNISHWNFNEFDVNSETTLANKLSNNILLIADGDIKNKKDRVKNLKSNLKNNFILLNYKEIENHIPHKIILKAAKTLWQKSTKKTLFKIERLDSITPSLFLDQDNGIGEILERYVDKSEENNNTMFRDKSGTIKNKKNFCLTVIEIMNSEPWELTQELTELCEKIWNFIEKHNYSTN